MHFAVEWHDRLGSTNAYLKELFADGGEISTGHIVAAHVQTMGRGRQERRWISEPDTNLCFSLFVETDADVIAVPSLTIAVALAVTDMLKACRIPAAPKWPNDVLVGSKKICGILSERVETSFANHLRQGYGGREASEVKRSGIIVGIGLNVNMSSEEAEAIDRPATSMLIESGRAHDLIGTLESLFPHLAHWIGEWLEKGFPALRQRWTEQSGPLGKPLSVHDGDNLISGKLGGYGEHGELLLQTANGLETIWSGDVS